MKKERIFPTSTVILYNHFPSYFIVKEAINFSNARWWWWAHGYHRFSYCHRAYLWNSNPAWFTGPLSLEAVMPTDSKFQSLTGPRDAPTLPSVLVSWDYNKIKWLRNACFIVMKVGSPESRVWQGRAPSISHKEDSLGLEFFWLLTAWLQSSCV